MAENSQEYIIKAGSDVLHLTDQADAGFTIKIRDDSPDMLSPRGLGNLFAAAAATTTTVGGRGHEDIRIIETEDSNEVAIMLLVSDPHVEYVAPLFSSNGETVAVIPEIVVRLRDKDQLEALEAACQQLGHQITRPLEFTDLEFLIHPRAKNADDVFRAVAELSALDIVDWAVPNLAFRLIQCGRLIPDDEYFPNQWHLDETEDFGWPGLDDINAPEAWEITVGDPNIVVALIDNGIDMNHPDLKDNIWVNEHETPDNGLDDDGNGYIDDCRGWDFSRDDNNPHDSSNPHATCCAGLIAARGNNGIGVTGVTWNCKLMPVQMIQEGELIYSYVADERIATGIRWAASHGADIMCIPSGSKSTYKTTYSAIKDVTEPGGIGRGGKGCVVVCAAGNNRGPIIYPAAYDETIAVSYWNRGHYVDNLKTPARGPELDLVAPSCAWGCWEKQWYEDPNIGIWTTAVRNRNTGWYFGCPSEAYNIPYYTNTMWGTSAACPIVAGVAALVLSVDPNLTGDQVKGILFESAWKDSEITVWHEAWGFGSVDARAAVEMASNPPLLPRTLYVDDDAPADPSPGVSAFRSSVEESVSLDELSDPLEDGSLEHPFDAIQEAISKAVPGDTVIVLPGTYIGAGNRDITFGGMAINVRSRDGAETCIIDCNNRGSAFRFTTCEGPDSVLDGFEVTGAKSSGVLCRWASPTIIRCRFIENTASFGGGIHCSFESMPWRGERCESRSGPTIVECEFIGNTAKVEGGAVAFVGCSTVLSKCRLQGNSAPSGGAIANYPSARDESPSELFMDNCIVSGNSAGNRGGGLYSHDIYYPHRHARSVTTNCTLVGNSATHGGAIYARQDSTEVINCIVRNNRGEQIDIHRDNLYDSRIVRFNNLEGGSLSEDNIDADPRFAKTGYWDPNDTTYTSRDDFWVEVDGDYHLKSQVGRWDPVNESWLVDDVTSPCIDAGDPNSPVGDEPEPNGGRINMGAYGGTAEASKSPEN